MATIAIKPGMSFGSMELTPDEYVLRFTKRERDCLERAAAIACAARERMREVLGTVDADNLDVDTDLGMLECCVDTLRRHNFSLTVGHPSDYD